MRHSNNKDLYLATYAAICGIAIVSLFLGIFCGYDAVIRYLTVGIWAI